MPQGLNFVMMHVHDVEGTSAFYADKLGLTVEARQPGFVQFAPTGGGAAFALGQEEAGEAVELWWYVDDADAEHAALRDRGVEIVSPPVDVPFGRTFAIKDPEGATLYMLQLPRQD